jgi:class 3 adenylate cyclase
MLRLLATEPQRRVRAVDGTCVFVDVSGFTRLSERLARRGGREGAEQLADVSAKGRSGLADATRGARMIATVAACIGAWSAASPIRSPIKAHCSVYLVKTT